MTMFCRKCGTPTEGDATICPSCAALEAQKQADQTAVTEDIPSIENILQAETPAEAPAEAPAATEAAPFALGTVEQEEPPKKGKLLKALLLIGGIAAVAALVFLVVSLVTRKTPEERFVSLKEDFVESAVDGVTQLYDNYQLSQNSELIYAYEMKLRLLMAEDILSSLESMAGTDMRWLADAGLNIRLYQENGLAEGVLDLVLKETPVLTYDVFMDGTDYYMGLPLLTTGYIKIDANDLDSDYRTAQAEAEALLQQIMQMLPTQEQMQDLTRRYLTIILNSLNNMTYEFETVTAGQYQEELLVYTITLDDDTLTGVVEAVVAEMRTDKTLEAYLNQLSSTLNDGTDVYAQFRSALDELDLDKAQTSEYEYSVQEYVPVLKLYINDDDEVVGISMIDCFETGDETILESVLVEDGDAFGFYMDVDGQSAITGEGEYSGDAVTGDFKIYDEDQEMLKISLQEVEMDGDTFKGTVDLRLGDALWEELLGSDGAALSMVSPVLSLTGNVENDQGTIELYLKTLGQKLVGISLNMETIVTKSLSLPATTYTVDQMDQWIDSFDFTELKQTLQTVGLPQELLEEIMDAMQ